MNNDGWFEVDSSFALFYMTLLANKICERRAIALLTDSTLSSNLSDLVRLDNQIAIKERDRFYHQDRNEKYIHLAQGMLTNLVIEGIQISKASSLEDVINFKKRHRDELGLFRNNIAKLTKDIPKDLPFASLKQHVEDIYNDEFCPAYNNFKKSLNSAGIKWTAENFMKIAFFSASTTSIPLAYLGLSIPLALLAGAGASMITSLVSYNVDKTEKLRNNPYSYLLGINKYV